MRTARAAVAALHLSPHSAQLPRRELCEASRSSPLPAAGEVGRSPGEGDVGNGLRINHPPPRAAPAHTRRRYTAPMPRKPNQLLSVIFVPEENRMRLATGPMPAANGPFIDLPLFETPTTAN